MRAQPDIVFNDDCSRLMALMLYRHVNRIRAVVCRPYHDIRADKHAISDEDGSAAVGINHYPNIEEHVISDFEPAALIRILA